MSKGSRNKLLIIPLAVIMLLLGVLGVNAAASLTLNTVTWNDETKVNITTKSANDASLVNISFITIRFSATNTINSTTSNVINITNTTATNFDFGYANFTFSNDIQLVDTTLGSVTGVTTGVGDSGNIALSATTVTIDRSNPSINGLSNIGTGLATNLQTITFGVINSTSWRFFHNGIVIQTTSVTGNLVNTTASQQITLRDSGSYYVEARDGTNTTTSATISYTMAGRLIKSSISTKQAEVKKVVEQQKAVKQQKSNKGILLIGFIIIMFVIIGGMMMTPKVRRKRR